MQELKDINVIDRKESLVHTDKGVILNISVTALEDIAQPELILFE